MLDGAHARKGVSAQAGAAPSLHRVPGQPSRLLRLLPPPSSGVSPRLALSSRVSSDFISLKYECYGLITQLPNIMLYLSLLFFLSSPHPMSVWAGTQSVAARAFGVGSPPLYPFIVASVDDTAQPLVALSGVGRVCVVVWEHGIARVLVGLVGLVFCSSHRRARQF